MVATCSSVCCEQLLLLLILFILNRQSSAGAPLPEERKHTCGHSIVSNNLTLFNQKHDQHINATKSHRASITKISLPIRELPNDQPRPLRIAAEYQIDDLSPSLQHFVTHQLVPVAIVALESTIQVKRPVHGRLKLPRYCMAYYPSYPHKCLEYQPSRFMDDPDWAYCGHAEHNDALFESYELCHARQPGYPSEGFDCERHETEGRLESDFYLYVTALESEYCTSAIGYAMYCSLDLDTNRPLAGSINLCPSSLSLDPATFQSQVEVTVHELLHTLIFSESLFERFIDANGQTIPKAQVVETVNQNGRSFKRIVSPRVVAKSREHFNCSTLAGADLEDEGGEGTTGNHWETRIFNVDVLFHYYLLMSFACLIGHALSPLTLALLEDSGWYAVNWQQAGFLHWGKDAGCSFAEDLCDVYRSKYPSQRWFCTEQGEAACTANRNGYGRCSGGVLLNSCKVIQLYSNGDCKAKSSSSSGSIDWGTTTGPNSYCLEVHNPFIQEYEHGQSRCRAIKGSRKGDCFQVNCEGAESFAIQIQGQQLPCHHSHQTLTLSTYLQQFIQGGVHCPQSELVCATNHCPEDCNGNGWCWKGQCICQVGFGGVNCAQRMCNSRSAFCTCDTSLGDGNGLCIIETELRDAPVSLDEVQSDHPDQVLQFSIKIRGAESNVSQSGLIDAFSGLLEDVSTDDIFVMSTEVTDFDHPWTIKMSIITEDPLNRFARLAAADESGALGEALAQVEISYIQGSFAELTTGQGTKSDDNDLVKKNIANFIFLASSLLFFVVVVSVICHAKWRARRAQNQHPELQHDDSSSAHHGVTSDLPLTKSQGQLHQHETHYYQNKYQQQ